MLMFAFAGIMLCSFGASQATGPLKVHPDNPRYFADGSGKAIYLTGAHTWSNMKDMGRTDPPTPFDFDGYLDFLQEHNHNFIRLWTWELSKYSYKGANVYSAMTYAHPFPWERTGPGKALDGKPKFDLTKFDQSYFDRLRSRVIAAYNSGIYISIMLFEGHGIHASQEPWCWDGHPFNVNNNVNGINGDPDGDGRGIESQTLQVPEITKIQEMYVRKVIDAVNDMDNVLYEIVNESGSYSTEWQYHIINYIHKYEKTQLKQHPVGMTFQWAKEQRGTNLALFNSPAEWISPNPDGGYRDDPPPADGSKVILTDTDHLWGIGGNQAWVWKSFCRGLNPLFMDPYREPQDDQKDIWTDHLSDKVEIDPRWEPIRMSMGYTLIYAEKMDLASMVPRNDLASTRYCLAKPLKPSDMQIVIHRNMRTTGKVRPKSDAEFLVYLPDGGKVTVNLSEALGTLAVEWFNPTEGETFPAESITGGGRSEFTAPFDGDAVLYITSGK